METQNVETKSFAIDNAHSNIGFNVKHMMFSKVVGHFDEYTSSIEMAEDNFENAKLAFEAVANSINTNNADRDKHLKGADFFNAEKAGNIVFNSTNIVKKGENDYTVEGDLTINNVTKPIRLAAEYSGIMKDPWGNDRIALIMNTKINREDWNMTYNAALETGGVLVGKEVKLEIDAQFV